MGNYFLQDHHLMNVRTLLEVAGHSFGSPSFRTDLELDQIESPAADAEWTNQFSAPSLLPSSRAQEGMPDGDGAASIY